MERKKKEKRRKYVSRLSNFMFGFEYKINLSHEEISLIWFSLVKRVKFW